MDLRHSFTLPLGGYYTKNDAPARARHFYIAKIRSVAERRSERVDTAYPPRFHEEEPSAATERSLALGRGNRLVRAGRGAGTAVNALVGVDHVGRTLADSLGGASILAATARNALVGSNLMSHFLFSFFVV
jgi:hypothetical protein